jgi:hypothetical protein
MAFGVAEYECLKEQIEAFGFDVTEGSFLSPDGRHWSVKVTPVDPEALVYAAARVYSDRAYTRRQKVLARKGPPS